MGQVDSFGIRLAGSKRDKYLQAANVTPVDKISNVPLSKSWPKQDISTIDDNLIAAFIKAARDEIPPKPRISDKLAIWAEKVLIFRELAIDLASGALSKESLKKKLQSSRSMRDLACKIDLMQKLDRALWDRITSVQHCEYAHSNHTPDRIIFRPSVIINQRKEYNYKISWTEKLDEICADLLDYEESSTRKNPVFEVRGFPGSGYFINRKNDVEYRALSGRFKTMEEACTYLNGNLNKLERAWSDVKVRDNVGKGDIRRENSRPRTGKNWRNGKNATKSMFEKNFGFSGLDFGNWVKRSTERQELLNNAYDALMDLADILGISTKALSLNGELGLAFGARGSGQASAHFEASETIVKVSKEDGEKSQYNFIINLTKTRGNGSLAHEFFHALDNYFMRIRGTNWKHGNKGGHGLFITYAAKAMMVYKGKGEYPPLSQSRLRDLQNTYPANSLYKAERWRLDPNHNQVDRPEIGIIFEKLVDVLDASPMRKRSLIIDKNKSGNGYWSSIIERAARSFECFIVSEMHKRGFDNDYLANIKEFGDWTKNPERYPYLKPDEIKPVVDAFRDLFTTLETKETVKGVALYIPAITKMQSPRLLLIMNSMRSLILALLEFGRDTALKLSNCITILHRYLFR